MPTLAAILLGYGLLVGAATNVSAAGVVASKLAFPQFDTDMVCRAAAEYAFAATLGEADVDKEKDACRARERDSMVSAQALWLRVSETDKAECLGLARSNYGYLDRCLAASRSVRASR